MSTKKPWQYEEIVIEQGTGRDFEGDLWLYVGEDKQIGVVTQEAPGGAEAWANLFRASPALARSLLREIRVPRSGEYHIHSCIMERRGIPGECIVECKEAIGALKMAGALG
jgi:hypothetical protein